MVQIKTQIRLSITCLLLINLTGCLYNTGLFRPSVEEQSRRDRATTQHQSTEQSTSGVNIGSTVTSESRTELPMAAPITGKINSSGRSPAVIALLDTANKQKQSGSIRAAESSIERAQRISPRDPNVYYQWADVRRLQHKWNQAEQLALKGANLATGDPIMLRRIWLLIAAIREQAGNTTAAANARKKAMSY